MSILNKLLGGDFLNSVNKIVDNVVTSDEERKQLDINLKQLIKTHKKEMFELEVEDRKSARSMYSTDSGVQKILATIFTLAYFALSFVMFRYFVLGDLNLGEFEISFISTIFGAMSAKVNTIVDFFFGGSSNNKKK
jgi:hypothetical protein|tara:strand:- start:2660 stop:3067 length:408 start_codon:yes stop_codon:yes gene_type:complete